MYIHNLKLQDVNKHP